MKPEQIKALEDIVNREVRKNTAVETEITDIETAKRKGAMALFGEVRRYRARADHGWRLLGGAVRRYPCQAYR